MNLREFENWALEQGSVGNPDESNSYKGQCVSLVQQYLNKVFGIPFKARGNAKDWANANIEGFDKISPNNDVRPGDILVYGPTNSNPYGHVAIIDADGRFLEQNKNGNRKVTVGDIRPNRIAILRPHSIDLGNVDVPYHVGQTYTTQVDLKVRDGAGTNYRQKTRNELTPNAKEHAYNYNSAVLKTGTRVTCLEVKNVGNDVWIRIPSGWIAARYDGKEYVK